MADDNVVSSYKACVPAKGMKAGRLRDVALKFLNARPETGYRDAPGLVAHAISDAFPYGKGRSTAAVAARHT